VTEHETTDIGITVRIVPEVVLSVHKPPLDVVAVPQVKQLLASKRLVPLHLLHPHLHSSGKT
jgi:hypothetical protein